MEQSVGQPANQVTLTQSGTAAPVVPGRRFIHYVCVALGGVGALAALTCLALAFVDVFTGKLALRTGLLLVAALLFVMVFAQAAMHISGGPLRERMIHDTSKTIENLAFQVGTRSGHPLSVDTARLLADTASTVAQWVMFFGSRAAAGGLLVIVAEAALGVLTVVVAYQQVLLLKNQTTIMGDQTTVMQADNNARTLEFHLRALIDDVRELVKVVGGPPSVNETFGGPVTSWSVLEQRANVLSRTLKTLDQKVDVWGEERTLPLSTERGVLIAALVAERFRFNVENILFRDVVMQLQSADLSALPPSPAFSDEGLFDLGYVDFTSSYAATAELSSYNLQRVDFTKAILPPAIRFRKSRLRDSSVSPTAAIQRLPSAILSGAQVPSDNWLRELEGVVGVDNFGASPWRIVSEGRRHFVQTHSMPEMQLAEEVLARAAVAAATDCIGSQESCEPLIARFCNHFGRLFVTPQLTARERGSLFAFAELSARSRWILSLTPSADRPGLRTFGVTIGRLRRCVYDTAFARPQPLDLSLLQLHEMDFRSHDLSQVLWDGAIVSGYFRGALLPSADNFAKANNVSAFRLQLDSSEDDAWVGVRVPDAEWEHKVCMKRAQARIEGDDRHVPFFPFSRYAVAQINGAFVLQLSQCAGQADWSSSDSQDARKRYCDACASAKQL